MQTADWALIISLFSMLVSLAGFVWNVWSKFIFLKPRLQVGFRVMRVHPSDPVQRYLWLDVTNHGPGDVIISCAIAHPIRRWFQWRVPLALLNPIDDLRFPDRPTGPFGAGLPKKLGVGEELSLQFPYVERMFMRESLEAIGVRDSFSRLHWAPKSDFEKALARYRRDFPIDSDDPNAEP